VWSADQYTTKPNIYHTLGEHPDQYATKPNIYHTLGEHADRYTTKPNIYHTEITTTQQISLRNYHRAYIILLKNHICGVLVSRLTYSVVDNLSCILSVSIGYSKEKF
jgi:hypothetical protein